MGKPTNPNSSSKEIRHYGILGGTPVGWLLSPIFVDETDTGDVEAGIVASAVGAVIGLFVVFGQIVYKRIRKNKKSSKKKPPFLPEDSNNVTHNRVKAGATSGTGVGCVIGAGIGACIPLPLAEKLGMMIGGAIGGVLGSLIAIIIPWWVPPSPTQKPQANPTSERIRSGAMLGVCVGVVFGAFVLGTLTSFGLPLCILFGIGLGTTVFSLAAYYLDENSSFEKADVSNPWAKRIRAGIQWGAFLGILVGVLLPGLGIGLSTTLSVVVGGALFSIGGAVISFVAEPIITQLVTCVAGEDYATANPWGPRARCGSFYGSWIGMLIGCCIFPGFIGATLGSAIGGLVGGLVGILVEPIYLACRGYYSMEKNSKEKAQIDEEDLSCPSGNQWSERCRTGAQVGAALGALIGFFVFPPFGVFFGSAIGGILGGAIAFLISAAWNHKNEPDAAQGYMNVQETSSTYQLPEEKMTLFNSKKLSVSDDMNTGTTIPTRFNPCVLL